jgi:thioredoxin reductase (NADPH)
VVITLSQQADGRFLLSTSLGKNFLTKTIFIAAGVGSFQPRTLKIAGIERFYQQQIFFEDTNPSRYINKHIVVLGDDDCALDSCLNLVDEVHSLTLIHRRHELKAKPDSIAKIRALCDSSSMRFTVGQVSGFEEANQLLSALIITGQDGLTRRIPLDILLAFLGLSPKLGPIADWGLQLDRKQILVDTEKFSTNIPGIYAVGDINTYPGKKKLILCGFHEATLAAFAAKEYLYPEKKVHLQYTTTSPKIHQLLGVNTPRND